MKYVFPHIGHRSCSHLSILYLAAFPARVPFSSHLFGLCGRSCIDARGCEGHYAGCLAYFTLPPVE